jgi:hypothetical protein
MRKIVAIALAAMMGVATPVFMTQTASAQQAGDQQQGNNQQQGGDQGGLCSDPTSTSSNFSNPTFCLGLALFAAGALPVIILAATEHQHQPVSP